MRVDAVQGVGKFTEVAAGLGAKNIEISEIQRVDDAGGHGVALEVDTEPIEANSRDGPGRIPPNLWRILKPYKVHVPLMI
jgi:hypothetical protein